MRCAATLCSDIPRIHNSTPPFKGRLSLGAGWLLLDSCKQSLQHDLKFLGVSISKMAVLRNQLDEMTKSMTNSVVYFYADCTT